jgi:UDP-4-amino-4,6-dideoxy-N-acetyl-beta-L-altrosamine transaminase
MKSIPYSRQSISHADVTVVIKALGQDLLTTGPLVPKFENQLCATIGVRHAIAVSNCTTALHIACKIIDIKPGDKGVTSPITFLASANCIEYCGGNTDFIDIDPTTLCLSSEELRYYCEQQGPPKVVIAVSYGGSVGELPEIWNLAQQFGFMVIEDAAHSLGTSYYYKGQVFNSGSCAHSHMATLSFHPVKNITTGEGGAVLTNSEEFAARARLFRSHGMERNKELLDRYDGPWYYEMTDLGFNYRINDIQAALGISQLSRLPEFKAKRMTISRSYHESFCNNTALITPPLIQSNKQKKDKEYFQEQPCRHIFPIQCVQGEKARLALYKALHKEEILCQVHYIPVYWQPYYKQKYNYQEGKCPNAEHYYQRTLSIPFFTELKSEEIKMVTEKINQLTEAI